ncbi:MAG: hypothetical protein KAH54_02205 [Candidatus Sabulitectum sp.]|nr:hypothetical protein [Candidatus Sabulitectum sp.]
MTKGSYSVMYLLLILLSSSAYSQTNPFLSGGSPAGEESSEIAMSPGGPASWPVVGSLFLKSTAAQRSLQQIIASSMDDVTNKGNLRSIGLLLGVSFVFGILHVMGPGHRKAVLVTYFLGEKTKPIKGFITGFLLALVHAASAILLVGGLYLFTTRSLLVSVDKTQTILFPVTYAIILILGIWMIFQGIREHKSKDNPLKSTKKTGIGGLILSGLVPCPAASAIIILAIAGNALPIGIISVLMMSLGMGILLAVLGLLTILFRNRISGLMQDSMKRLELTLHLISGSAMALFGFFMMLGSL